MKRFLKIDTFKTVAAFLIPAIFVLLTIQCMDNDSWGVLAEGREIVNGGVYHTDVLSMHEGLHTVLQNYLFAVPFYYIFQIFGGPGIYTAMLLLNFLICLLLYKICMLISGKNKSMSLAMMMATDILLAFLGFVVTRAQMVSFVIFLSFIYVLELYIKNGKVKYLWWVPVLSVLQVNIHASLWWMLLAVLITFIIDAPKKKPLLIAGAGFVFAGLINPYGLEMLTFIFKAYSDSTFSGMVQELQPFSPLSSVENAFFYIAFFGVIVAYTFSKRKNVRLRYLLMLFGFLTLGLNTVKGLSQVVLVMFFPLALLFKDVRIGKIIDNDGCKKAISVWTGILATAVFAVVCPIVILGVPSDYTDDVILEATNTIDSYVEDGDKRALKVYTGYNIGGYVEYRGYRPYMDPRGADFIKKMNGKEDIFNEYSDFENGKIDVADFVDKYHFDYIYAVGEDDPFYEFKNDDYIEIYRNEEKHVKVYKILDKNLKV